MRVRRAAPHDFAGIHALLDQLLPAEAGERCAVWTDALRHDGYAAWVAEADDRCVGFVDLFLLPDAGHGRFIGLINNLVVDAAYRGRGLGERLVREAAEHSKRERAVELHVWTDFNNGPALSVYKRCGFAERALLLELNLEPV